MADTIKLKLIKDLEAQLSKITVANGYNFNLGDNVSLVDRTFPVGQFVALFYGDEQAAPEGFGAYQEEKNSFSARIEGHVPRQDENVAYTIEKIIGDLQKCCAESWTTYADSIKRSGSGHEEWPEVNTTHIGAYITLDIQYSTRAGDPYTQI